MSPRDAYPSSSACIVIVVLSRREIGHPVLAASVAFSQAALSALGTFPLTSNMILVTVHPASSLSNVTVAVVSSFSGVKPAFPNCADSAIAKQPACAAAINSSGLVPFPLSDLVENEYWVGATTAVSVEAVAFRVVQSRCQFVDRLVCMVPPCTYGIFPVRVRRAACASGQRWIRPSRGRYKLDAALIKGIWVKAWGKLPSPS